MSGKSHLLWNMVSLLYNGIYKEVFINLEKFMIYLCQIALFTKMSNM